MKKLLLLSAILTGGNTIYAQTGIFMKMIENKMICNKEDQLTYFLQSNSYERKNENHYVHNYVEGKGSYFVDITNDNECFVLYRTDNVKDYTRIKTAISSACPKEYSGDKSVSYICNNRKVQDVQIIFNGYSQQTNTYDIQVFQNPNRHELPYNQSDRSAANYDK